MAEISSNESFISIAEQSRGAREESNRTRCIILRLAPEIRNQIYEHIIPANDIITRDISHYKAHGKQLRQAYHFPALLHTSRQIRKDNLPLFFGNNTFAIHLRYLMFKPKASLRPPALTDLLTDESIASLRHICIVDSSSCRHSYSVVEAEIYVGIDRVNGKLSRRLAGSYSEGNRCCRKVQEEYLRRLVPEVETTGFHLPSHRLMREDFQDLAERMVRHREEAPGKFWKERPTGK